jgi:hypothetical protein
MGISAQVQYRKKKVKNADFPRISRATGI